MASDAERSVHALGQTVILLVDRTKGGFPGEFPFTGKTATGAVFLQQTDTSPEQQNHQAFISLSFIVVCLFFFFHLLGWGNQWIIEAPQ